MIMFGKRTMPVILVIGLIGFSFTAAATAADTKPVRIAGKLTKIDGKALTITDKDGKETVVTCNDATKVHRDGDTPSKQAKFADLQVGQQVRAYCTKADKVVLGIHIAKTSS
jgi:hypothetical protein